MEERKRHFGVLLLGLIAFAFLGSPLFLEGITATTRIQPSAGTQFRLRPSLVQDIGIVICLTTDILILLGARKDEIQRWYLQKKVLTTPYKISERDIHPIIGLGHVHRFFASSSLLAMDRSPPWCFGVQGSQLIRDQPSSPHHHIE